MSTQTGEILERLEKYTGSGFPILSVYFGTDQIKSPTRDLFLSQLHSQIHEKLDKNTQKTFKKDIERLDSFIRTSWDSRGKRSLVVFTSGKKLWEILDFEFYLHPQLIVSNKPATYPLTKALDKYKPYLVLLADREKARLFTVHLGKIREHKDVFNGEVPQRVKHGDDTWDQQNKIQRHIEDHLHRHLELIAQETKDFVRKNPVRFVIVGGHKDIIPKVKGHLTYPVNKMALGTFVTELNIPLNNIFLHSKKISAQINRGWK
jgi:hypothetical protein